MLKWLVIALFTYLAFIIASDAWPAETQWLAIAALVITTVSFFGAISHTKSAKGHRISISESLKMGLEKGRASAKKEKTES